MHLYVLPASYHATVAFSLSADGAHFGIDMTNIRFREPMNEATDNSPGAWRTDGCSATLFSTLAGLVVGSLTGGALGEPLGGYLGHVIGNSVDDAVKARIESTIISKIRGLNREWRVAT
jgi:hypothetical protein